MKQWQTIGLLAILMTGTAVAGADRQDIADHYAQLADPQPLVREAAASWLMTLSSTDLDTLKSVAKGGPVLPAQAASLRPIVDYVLVRETQLRLPRLPAAFMGVAMAKPGIDANAVIIGPQAQQPVQSSGVTVTAVIPGFAAARLIESGDVILGFTAKDQRTDVNAPEELIAYIVHCQSGQQLTVHLQRAGRLIDVPLTLDARPDLPGQNEDEQSIQLGNATLEAQRQAKIYFDQNFRPLLGEPEEVETVDQ